MIRTIGQLKKLIKDLPDDTPVLSSKMSGVFFTPANLAVTHALKTEIGFAEDYGECATPEQQFGKRKRVLLVG